MLENSWNTSFRIMFGLSLLTHRYFVEPISGKANVKNMLMKRFLSFLNQIEKSEKRLPKKMLKYVKKETRSTTGSNLRKIMLLVNKIRIEDVTMEDANIFKYARVPPEDEWRVGMAKEIIEIRSRKLEVENFDDEEIEEMLVYICTS